MRSRLLFLTVAFFLAVGTLILATQVDSGALHLLVGAGLALPWIAAALVAWYRPRLGGWLAAAVASLSLGCAIWFVGETSDAQGGAEIAIFLFASPEGYWSWMDVGVVTMGFALLFVTALVLAAGVVAREGRGSVDRIEIRAR